MAQIRGLIPMLVTPFSNDDELDDDALRALVQSQLVCGVDGLAMLGVGGEGFAVTADERDRIVRIVCDEVAGGVPLVVGVAATGDRLGIEQSIRAEQAGADCLMVLPPYLIKPDPDRLVEYYRSITDAVSIPLMVQDAPDVGVPITTAMFRDLASLPRVTHAKIETSPTVPKINAVHAALGDALIIIGGRGGLALIEELDCGAAGTMPYCDLTDSFRKVLDLGGDSCVNPATTDPSASAPVRVAPNRDGALEAAQRAFNRVLPLLEFSAQSGAGQAVAKEVLRLRGILPNSRVRNPAKPLDDRIRTGLTRVLASTDLNL